MNLWEGGEQHHVTGAGPAEGILRERAMGSPVWRGSCSLIAWPLHPLEWVPSGELRGLCKGGL